MAMTSIHINPVKSNSEAHNERRSKLDYVQSDLTPKNQSVKNESISSAKARIEDSYKKTVGQKMQAKATPIREGVVVLDKNVRMEHLEKLGAALEKRFGIKTIQIHIHEDEGHKVKKTGEWKENRHAHMVFDWTQASGKSLRLNKEDMAEIQTITAECLEMDRGQSSDRKHLSSIGYKVQKMTEEAMLLEKNQKEMQSAIKEMQALVKGDKKLSNALLRLQKKDPLSLANAQIEELASSNKELKREKRALSKENTDQKEELSVLKPFKPLYEKERAEHAKVKESVKEIKEVSESRKKVALIWKDRCIKVAKNGSADIPKLQKFLIEKKHVPQNAFRNNDKGLSM